MAVHQVRREAFLDVAQALIQTKGYEQMSIQDVLDALETSRGAFYHYFDSKQALLENVVQRFADGGMAAITPVLDDPALPALRKLERIFSTIADFKAEQKELVLAIIDVWTSDGNALVREKLRRMSARLLLPVISRVVTEGIAEGVVAAGTPDETATVLITLVQGYQEIAGQQFLDRQAGRISWEVVQRSHAAFTQAFERILGIPAGSLTLMDEATMRFWFG
jgi:AcrR family transcriptional regulator